MNNHINKKMAILKAVSEGAKVVVINPEKEYKDLLKMVGENPKGGNLFQKG